MRDLKDYKVVTEFEELKYYDFYNFIFNHPDTTIFHTEEISRFYKAIPNYDPFLIALVSGEKIKAYVTGNIMNEGGVLKYFSSRAVIDGGILLARDEPRNHFYLNAMLFESEKILRNKKVIYAEIRNLFDYGKYKTTFNLGGWNYYPFLNFIVDCRDEQSLLKKMSKSKIRQVKKSLESGTEIISNPSREDIENYYLILKDLYKNKVKKPLRPREFFMSFNDGLGKYLLVKYEGKVIGGIMCPIYNGKYMYEWFVAGDDVNYKKLYPSVVATWGAIDYACKNGIHFFDFMGAGTPDKDYGVREFKSKFGGELVEYGRFMKVYNRPVYNLGKTYINLFKKEGQY